MSSTQRTCKKKFYNHKTNFVHSKYIHTISVSKHVRNFKNKHGIDPFSKWKFVKRGHNYMTGDKFCLLCMEEKLTKELLNQRSKILNECRHKNKWLLNCLLFICFVHPLYVNFCNVLGYMYLIVQITF